MTLPELKWLKSSFSEASGNNCVEIAATDDRITLRESDSPAEVLTTGPGVLNALLCGLKTGHSGPVLSDPATPLRPPAVPGPASRSATTPLYAAPEGVTLP
jgi:hypothetical protein